MALKATIYKCELSIADMDRHYYADHNLTIALHPSETPARMMYRLIAFAVNANDDLEFTKGISTDDEPDIWSHTLSGEIDHWIELGQPDEKRVRRACGRSRQVSIYTYSGHSAEIWWQQAHSHFDRFDHLRVFDLPSDHANALSEMTSRTMQINCSIQDHHILWSDNKNSLGIVPVVRKP